MSNIVQFTSASNFIAASAPSFAAVPIKYFLAAYCPALDPYVTAAEDIPDLETIFPTSAVNIPEGVEVLYNLGALSSFYQLSNDKALYYTIGQSGVNTISGSDFNDVAKVNLLSGHPLSTIVSGTSFVYEDGVWTVGAPDEITGINTVPSGYPNSRDKFYSDVSFAPITSGAEVRGLYKMKMGKSTGTFKYNLLIPYVTRFIDSTTEDTTIEPVMFAVLKLNYPITKSTVDGDGNFSSTEHDLSIGFSSEISGAQNHFFLDGGYWLYNGLTNSVSWDGDVVINTSAVPGSWVPDAKLTTINTNPNKAIYKATFNGDFTKRYFYTSASVPSAISIDDTVYSTDRVSITKRSAGNTSSVSTLKEKIEGDSRTVSLFLFNDENMIRGGQNAITEVNYLTAGVSGNSIQIISGGLNSKVIIGATSGHNQLLSAKYGSLATDALLTVHGDVEIDGELRGNVDISGSLFTSGSANVNNLTVRGSTGLQFVGIGGSRIAQAGSNMVFVSTSDNTGLTIPPSGAVTAPVSLTTPILNVSTSASINNTTFTGTSTFTGSLSVGTLSVANMTGTTVFNAFTGNQIDLGTLNASTLNTYLATAFDLYVTGGAYLSNNLDVAGGISAASGTFATLVAPNLTSLTVGSGTTMSKIVTGRTAYNSGGAGSASVVISNSSVNANSIILMTFDGAAYSPGDDICLRVSARSNGVSFTAASASGPSSSGNYINWMIINP